VLIEINPAALDRAGASARGVLSELRRCGDYTFEVVAEAGDERRIVEPGDCDSLDDYVNVLCRAAH
jgi:hypothetical protein